jgi:hypothetical protein
MGFEFILAVLLFMDLFDPLSGSLDITFWVKSNSFDFSINDIINEFLELLQFFVYLGVFPFGLLGFLIKACYLCVGIFEGCFEIIDGFKLILQIIEVFYEFVV